MINRVADVGYIVHGATIGELWLHVVETVLKNGEFELDENRGRFAVHNLRFSSSSTEVHDNLIDRYANADNIEAMKRLVFVEDHMKDFDITPSFRTGAKSYKKRIEEGGLLEFAITRLRKIPESKKAVLVFPTYEDYASVISSPWNDYLPCIVALQFRLMPCALDSFNLNMTLFMRSWDIFQKGAGDLTVVCMLGEVVRSRLSAELGIEIQPGRLDGLVTDVHIYENTYKAAQAISFKYQQDSDS